MSAGAREQFDGNYARYWRDRVENAPDLTRVPGDAALRRALRDFPVSSEHRLVDAGCGFGRFYPVFFQLTPHLIGVDVSLEMLNEATCLGYECLIHGQVEQTRLPDSYVDRIVCWATFDVTDQERALEELNRVLKPGGLVLLTGKNLTYHDDDSAAFLAERNAYLKAFPNHFTDVASLLRDPSPYGFSAQRAWGYERRGDFAEGRERDLLAMNVVEYYEFMLILRKEGAPGPALPALAHSHSATARERARRAGFRDDVPAFFRWHEQQGR